jgi:hypothetical protein
MTRTVITSAASGGGGAGSATPANNNWASGTFGTGLIRVYGSSQSSYSFTVPTGITSIRVRCFGAGGGGSSTYAQAGGGGGGFSIGEFDVVAGDSYVVTVGAGGRPNTSGGTSSFGSLISATGGVGANNSSEHAGGDGSGGYINHKGGRSQYTYGGGGGVASLFGHGGNGTYAGSNLTTGNNITRSGGAGGGFGYNSGSIYWSYIQNNAGPWGHHSYWGIGGNTTNDTGNTFLRQQIDSIDLLGTGSGAVGYQGVAANGVNGSGAGISGVGGWPGGGGGAGASLSYNGSGADGCVIVEY